MKSKIVLLIAIALMTGCTKPSKIGVYKFYGEPNQPVRIEVLRKDGGVSKHQCYETIGDRISGIGRVCYLER